MNGISRYILYLFITIFLAACKKDYRVQSQLTDAQQRHYLLQVAPFVNKKPKEVDFEDRFKKANQLFYQNVIEKTQARFDYFYVTDTAKFFLYTSKDITSLYEHYRAQGGYFKVNENDSLIFLNVLFYTPRFTPEELETKGKILFYEMIKKGDVQKFVGNRDYIHVPNADFEYSTQENRWVYTENSSWKFLDEAKEEAAKTNTLRKK
jgi:hypothetical protein